MKYPRPKKETDQQEIEKAYFILEDLVKEHPEIEITLWYSAFWSCIAQGAINSEYTYKDFCEMVGDMVNHAQRWFEDDR